MNRVIKSMFLIGVLGLGSCVDNKPSIELTTALKELEVQKQENQNLLSQIEKQSQHTGNLIHYVFLDVKKDVSEKQYAFLVKEIKNLSKIMGVEDLEIGRHENMDDDRALTEREINFEMRFEKKMDYYNYQKSKEHIHVRQLLAPFLASPPLTYDYLVQ